MTCYNLNWSKIKIWVHCVIFFVLSIISCKARSVRFYILQDQIHFRRIICSCYLNHKTVYNLCWPDEHSHDLLVVIDSLILVWYSQSFFTTLCNLAPNLLLPLTTVKYVKGDEGYTLQIVFNAKYWNPIPTRFFCVPSQSWVRLVFMFCN